MIIGHVHIDPEQGVVHTHNASYRLDVLKVAKAPRSFLGSTVLLSGLLVLFGISFHDILWPLEITTIAAICTASLTFGWNITQLTFHSRDLHGAQVSGALFGTVGHLNAIRHEIMAGQITSRQEERHE